MSPTFYLGTHQVNWLAETAAPLFVSRRRLEPYRTLPRARGRWALDSGGFTELSMHGRWTVSAEQYAAEARRFQSDIGGLDFAAPQDWMCEPEILKKTGLTVAEHQRRTLANYLELKALAPEVPWIPVLQGWSMGEYFRHAEMYEAAGVALADLPRVGVGTVCRRQVTMRASLLLSQLHDDGLRLHAFGFKLTGLELAAGSIASADSMAWSMDARRNPPLAGHSHKNCANCIVYAMGWRDRALDAIAEGTH